MFEIHDIYCRRFLHHFEQAQEKMLRLDFPQATQEFKLLFDCFNRECTKGLEYIAKHVPDQKDRLLLSGQLKKICKFIARFSVIVDSLGKNMNQPVDIINHFEEQYQFKKIVIRHLTDLEKIIKLPA